MNNHSLKQSFPSPSPSQHEVDQFVIAIGQGRISDSAAFIEKYPAAINRPSTSGNPAVNWAARAGQGEIVALLLENGADLEMKDKDNKTPLLCAAWDGHMPVMKLLQAKGADIHARDNQGWTPLMRAAWKGRADIVKFLWESGASIDATSNTGLTPLMLAANMGRTNTVIFLLEKGADAEAADSAGKTALMMARERGYHEPADLIEQRKRQKNSFAKRLERLQIVRPKQSPFKKKM
jgi:ankyrin repeat protein